MIIEIYPEQFEGLLWLVGIISLLIAIHKSFR